MPMRSHASRKSRDSESASASIFTTSCPGGRRLTLPKARRQVAAHELRFRETRQRACRPARVNAAPTHMRAGDYAGLPQGFAPASRWIHCGDTPASIVQVDVGHPQRVWLAADSAH
ncbi:hypothetical protein BV20DRAFT_166084 [Pilatotrama ljubarskyi]|nr:hypothetical protein BV20DRAFT_166084 [Pilatotrama ljubarskyi]